MPVCRSPNSFSMETDIVALLAAIRPMTEHDIIEYAPATLGSYRLPNKSARKNKKAASIARSGLF
jgi:hypothetical protein